MACADGRPHRWSEVKKYKPSSPALKRCRGCGKTVETYLWLKVVIGFLVAIGIIGAVIKYLDSIPAK